MSDVPLWLSVETVELAMEATATVSGVELLWFFGWDANFVG